MVEIHVTDESVDPRGYTLIEGMPGVGLVGKLATDHIIDRLDMTEFASVRGEGIPPVTVFDGGDRAVNSPIRLYADESRELLALRSDVPVHVMDAPAFAENLTGWEADRDVLPIYLGGLAEERDADTVPDVAGLGVGEGSDVLDSAGIAPPEEGGMISGPCGAFLANARDEDLDAVGLLVDTDPRFPDPQGAHALIEHGINPIADVDIDTERLVEEAEEIMDQREELAKRMQQAEEHEASQARKTGMFQ